MVEMRLSKIVITETLGQNMIVLQEAAGSRTLPIMIGPFEALAIRRGIREEVYARPQTHDLLASVIKGLSEGLDRIVVTELKEGTFYAKLVVRRNGQLVEFDARPSDSIALAVTVKCPIYCDESVLEAVAADQPPPPTA